MNRKTCDKCGKRCYSNPREARDLMRVAGNRVKVYWCSGSYHVTNADKGSNPNARTRQERAKRKQERRTERRKTKRKLNG